MAAALVETRGTWARTVARIDPAWAERLGAHLLKHSFSAPWWDPKRGETLAENRATLYGLPVVAGRPVSLARTDPGVARQMFIQHALVERDWTATIGPVERVAERLAAVRSLEERARQAGRQETDDRTQCRPSGRGQRRHPGRTGCAESGRKDRGGPGALPGARVCRPARLLEEDPGPHQGGRRQRGR